MDGLHVSSRGFNRKEGPIHIGRKPGAAITRYRTGSAKKRGYITMDRRDCGSLVSIRLYRYSYRRGDEDTIRVRCVGGYRNMNLMRPISDLILPIG